MTLPELKASPIFALLSKKEAAWVELYCTNGGDARAASTKVFKCATDRSAMQMTRRMMTEPRIVPVIAMWNGQLEDEPTLDEFRHELWRMAREEKGAARAALMRLYGETRGFVKKIGAVEPPKAVDPAMLHEIENPEEKK